MYRAISSNNTQASIIPNSDSKLLLQRINQILKDNMDNPSFSNKELARELKTSDRQLFRILNALTGMSPRQYIRNYRLKLARFLLLKGKCRTVGETAYAIGYTNVSYFITQFKKEFGKKPLQILQENGWR